MAMLADGAEWLIGQLKDAAGHSCTYRQPSRRPLRITAVRNVDDTQVVDADGLPMVVRQVSFVIDTTDAGDLIPQRGDRITETVGSRSREWEVAPRNDSGCWQYEDANHVMLRVFVVEVE